MIVYLAGGMRSGWQDRIMAAVPDHQYISPTHHRLDVPAQFTFWDMLAIKRSDLIFAYIEKDNPSGLGAAFEIGYGLGLGKQVVLVDRKSTADEAFKEYFALIGCSVPFVMSTLNEGITLLESLVVLDRICPPLTYDPEVVKSVGELFAHLSATKVPATPEEYLGDLCSTCHDPFFLDRGELRCGCGLVGSKVGGADR